MIIEILSLAIIQGLTEFLPISSSAHLLIISIWWNIENSLFLSIIFHLATLLAIIIYYRRDLILILKSFLNRDLKNKNYSYQLIIATLPAIFFGFFFLKNFNILNSFKIISLSLIISSLFFLTLLFLINFKGKKINLSPFNQAFIIGLFQALAIIPGISRSGSTIVGAKLIGFKNQEALKFSFLLAIPIIALSSLVAIFNYLIEPEILKISPFIILISFTLTLLIALSVIKLFSKFIEKIGLKIFFIYQFFLGITLFILYNSNF